LSKMSHVTAKNYGQRPFDWGFIRKGPNFTYGWKAQEKACRRGYKFVRKAEAKRQLGRQRRKWEANIKFDHCEIEQEGINWSNLGQDCRSGGFVNPVMNIRAPYIAVSW